MKKVFLFGLVALSLIGCGQKKVLTDKEAWDSFCKSAKGAAFNIMTDRQQDITKDAARSTDSLASKYKRLFI